MTESKAKPWWTVSFYLNRATALLGIAVLFSVPYRVGMFLDPPWLAYPVLTLLLVPMMVAFPFLPPVPQGRALNAGWLILLVLLAAAPRIRWILQVPFTAEMGDMLPLIQAAGERFLSGGDPYTEYQLPWSLPLTFFPVLWMSYLPAVATGLDLRWWALVAQLGVVVVLCRQSGCSRGLWPVLAFLVFPVFVVFSANAHTPPFWLYLAGFGAFSTGKRRLPAALCLGLSVASRQTAVILVPLAGLYWWRELGWRQAAKPLVLTAAVVGAFCLPFFLRNPHGFLMAPLEHYAELAEAYSGPESPSPHLLHTFGFGNIAALQGWGPLLSPLRGVMVGLCLAGVWFHARDVHTLLAWMCLAGWGLTLFTPIPWTYAYFPFWILGVFAAVKHPSSGRGQPPDVQTVQPE